VIGPALDATDAAAQPIRVAANLNLCFPGLDSEGLMLAMPGLAVSSGATCASADAHPSHVLSGMGLSDDFARGTLRFGLGRFNTESDVDLAIELVGEAAAKLREFG
jgi:cysteine desulfurase